MSCFEPSLKLTFDICAVCECDKNWESMYRHGGAFICPNVNVNANAENGSIHGPIGANAKP